MKNVLIPTDFSDNSWNAIRYALKLFEKIECNVYLLHVNPVPDYVFEGFTYTPSNNVIEEQLLEPSRKQLNVIVRRSEKEFFNERHHYFTLNEQGSFIDAVRNQVSEKQIDFIVMGTKGATGLKSLIIGSNTGDVITKVQCNTIVVPEDAVYQSLEEMAFATDYNIFYSPSILEVLTEILQYNKAMMRVMHVTKGEKQLTQSQLSNKEYLQNYLAETFPDRNSFHTLTNRSVSAAIQCFSESRDIDMLVMVAKNLNFLQHLLFNSTVEEISFHTQIPLLVLHE